MAEAEGEKETNHFSLQKNFPQIDLLQRFNSGVEDLLVQPKNEVDEEDDDDDDELSLGLSSNGRFGFNPKRPKNLIRSSSISSDFLLTSNFNMPLVRTCSLPMETEEEWRKRKNLQSLRRMEAKRKRVEKLKSGGQDQVNLGSGSLKGVLTAQLTESKPQRGNSLQGSTGSQGSGSSGLSEIESLSIQGTNKLNEAVSPISVPTLPEKKSVPSSRATSFPAKSAIAPAHTTTKATAATENGGKETIIKNVMLDMPCVSTRGDGPDGKIIEGFLYRYKKGEEVRIVCVCHGSFLTPAEFVKHAGGTDVSHPLKHIVVKPSPSLLC